MSSSIHIKANAKLNLGLRVLGVRPDGFHDLHTHLQAISLSDELRFERASGGLRVEAPGLNIPAEENLVHRAMALFQARTGFTGGVRCALTKRIPVGAGLGGGSSDAAATLQALNALFEKNLSPRTLAEWGAQLGSDVPFFLYGGLACVRGRGELIAPLPPAYDGHHFVVAVPPIHCATSEVYRAWDELELRGGDVACARMEHQNDLEPAALRRYPELARYAELMRQAPTPVKGLSGSGSAWYAGFPHRDQALAYRRSLERLPLQHQVFLVQSVQLRHERP